MKNDKKDKKEKRKLSRKQFLGLGALGVGTAAVGVVPLSEDSFYSAKFPKVDENKADLKPNGKTVCILGGGLAGIQAGVELSARGFKVTVLEKTGMPGGKLKSWRDKKFGPEDHPLKKDPKFKGFVREHGIHAIWGFYNNLREFMGRYGFPLMDMPKDYSIYTFLDKDGTQSYIPKATWFSPYSRLEQLYNLSDLKHLEGMPKMDMLSAVFKLFTFDYADKKQREYMDSMTFEQWGKEVGLSKAAIDKIFDSVLEMAYFNNADKLSALTIANLFQLIAGSPNDMDVNLYGNPPGETFLEPMVKLIKKKGGVIHYNTEVSKFIKKNGKIASIKTRTIVGDQKVRRCQVCGELIYGDDEYDVCPFCGAGAENLKVLLPEEKTEKTYTADYYINAMDIPAAKKLIAGNFTELGGSKYFENILDLNATEVYVVNFWVKGLASWKKRFHKKGEKNAILDFFATGFKHLGITLNWSYPMDLGDKKESMIKEYRGQDVSIIETQIAKVGDVIKLGNKEIADKCFAELKTVMPDIPDYESYYINKWVNYTTYLPGDEKKRPAVQSPIDNLLFIGDMSFVPHPAVFMEKTNVTAKWATNLLLDKIGQKEGKIKILRSGSPSSLVGTLKIFTSVKA